MLLTQLEYFVALAIERHFGRAAESCHVSQSGLSEAIHKLELELDVRLVLRGHAFEGITPEGEQLLVWARRMVADQLALRDAARAIGSGLTGTLRIGVVPSATASAALLVDRFSAEHDDVTVQLETDLPTEEIIKRIRRFELDAGVLYPVTEPTPDLTNALLYHERQRVVLTSAISAGRTSIRAAELTEITALPLALLRRSMRGRQILDDALASQGVVLEPRLTTDSIEALLALAHTGRWAVVVPIPPWGAPTLPEGVEALDLVDPVVSAPVVLATLLGEPMPVLAREIMRFARSSVF